MADADLDQEEMDAINALTSCPICMDPFEVPKVLPCQHTFCLQCLRDHHAATNAQRALGPLSNFPCPTCRTTCYIPRDGLDNLPNDFKVNQINDLVKAMRACRPPPAPPVAVPSGKGDRGSTTWFGSTSSVASNAATYCAVCRCQGNEKKATNMCMACNQHLCSSCSNSHRKNSLFSEHQVVSLSAPPPADASGAWKCETHPTADVAYFCMQCSVPACMLCVTCSHPTQHTVVCAKDALEPVRTKLRAAVAELTRNSKDLEARVDVIKKLRQEQAKAYSEATKVLKKAVQEAEQKLREAEKQAYAELKAAYDEKQQAIVAAEKNCAERMKSTKTISSASNDLASSSNIKHMLTEFIALERRTTAELTAGVPSPTLREYLTFAPEVLIKLGGSEKKVLTVQFEEPKARTLSGGAVASAPTPKSPLGDLLRRSFRSKDRDRINRVSNSQAAATTAVTATGTVAYVDEEDEDQATSMRSSRSDTLQREALVQRLQRRLSTRTGVLTPPPVAASPTPPLSVSASASTVSTPVRAPAVAPAPSPANLRRPAPARVPSPTTTRRAQSPVTIQRQFNTIINPTAPTTTAPVVVTSMSSTSVATVRVAAASTTVTRPSFFPPPVVPTPSPAPARTLAPTALRVTHRGTDDFIGRSVWKSSDFKQCRDCCFASSGGDVVAATDFNIAAEVNSPDRSRIKIFGLQSGSSSSWQILRSVESVLIGEPWGLCFNPTTESLLVTDHGANVSLKSVKVASVKEVSVWKSTPQIDRPSGIALMRNGDLVITETSGKRDNKRIGVYTSVTSGRISRTREFGARGDGEGELLLVNFVTVDNHDRIIVSDSENHIIKVFSSSGQEMLKCSSGGSDGAEMVPQGLAVDEFDNIFVADQSVMGVLKFSTDGLQIGDTLKTTAKPWGISYSVESKRLAVAHDRGLEIFQLS